MVKVTRKRVVLGACSLHVNDNGVPSLVYDSVVTRFECLDCEFFIPISNSIVDVKRDLYGS